VVSESPKGMASSVPFVALNQTGERSSITFRAILAQEPYLGDYGIYSKSKKSVYQTKRLNFVGISQVGIFYWGMASHFGFYFSS
jgi:hypothetical protein